MCQHFSTIVLLCLLLNSSARNRVEALHFAEFSSTKKTVTLDTLAPCCTYPEKIASLIFAKKEACLRCMLPSLGYIRCHAASCRILHYKSKVLLCQDCLLGIDDAHMAFPKLRLNLHCMSNQKTSPRLGGLCKSRQQRTRTLISRKTCCGTMAFGIGRGISLTATSSWVLVSRIRNVSPASAVILRQGERAAEMLEVRQSPNYLPEPPEPRYCMKS